LRQLQFIAHSGLADTSDIRVVTSEPGRTERTSLFAREANAAKSHILVAVKKESGQMNSSARFEFLVDYFRLFV